jgi:hypothetical protein
MHLYYNKYYFQKELGSGCFGKVFLEKEKVSVELREVLTEIIESKI